ncbi:MAG: hypothetical protein ACI8TX_002471 [Hyphomicrobiaceae bacterium]|jgi:hypothetical protein
MAEPTPPTPALPNGLVCVVKRDCPTCELVAPVLVQLSAKAALKVISQDDPTFPPGVNQIIDDRDLSLSWHHDINSVPTLLRVDNGQIVARAEGWQREDWEHLTGLTDLGPGLPDWRPGCGSLSVDPDRQASLRTRFEGDALSARRVNIADAEDVMEAMQARGWSDGLPLVPPTAARVLAMLDGTSRGPDEIVSVVPPDLAPCTVEKAAINAVMAGCKPEYFPVVITALEAVCTDRFNMHGVLATTMPVGPVLIVNGPIRRRIGMNSAINVFGQGNRANSTIGRALQLIVRNVGGGRPGEVDRATHGNPIKTGLAFAEDEEGSPWTPLSTDFQIELGTDAVTVFCAEGPRCVVDQLARDPEELARSFAACLRTVHHPKLPVAFDALLAVSPEHSRVFAAAGWSKERLVARLHELTLLPMADIVRGADGIAEGVPEGIDLETLPKFRPGGLLVVHCGGGAGLFSSIFAGWASGPIGSEPVAREIRA